MVLFTSWYFTKYNLVTFFWFQSWVLFWVKQLITCFFSSLCKLINHEQNIFIPYLASRSVRFLQTCVLREATRGEDLTYKCVSTADETNGNICYLLKSASITSLFILSDCVLRILSYFNNLWGFRLLADHEQTKHTRDVTFHNGFSEMFPGFQVFHTFF